MQTMDQYIYTNELPNSNSISNITSADVVLLNGNNIINDINAQYDGINPIPSFTVVKSISSLLSAKLSVIDDKLSSYDSRISSHMKYYGAFLKYTDDEAHTNNSVLSNFLASNLGNAATIDNGTMFRFISAVVLSDQQDSIELLSNDYIIFNKDVQVIEAQLSDFDIIRDACDEIKELSAEISTKIDISDISSYASKVIIDNRISNISSQTDLSIIKLSIDEYAVLLSTGNALSNALYVIEDNHIDAYGQQIKNVALPTDLSDAATKGYVDDSISNISIPTDLSDLTNSPGFLVSNDLSDYCYAKNETCSAIEISVGLSGKADESQLASYELKDDMPQDVSSIVLSTQMIISEWDVVLPDSVVDYGYVIKPNYPKFQPNDLHDPNSTGCWIIQVYQPEDPSDFIEYQTDAQQTINATSIDLAQSEPFDPDAPHASATRTIDTKNALGLAMMTDLETKQDKLSDSQISAIDSVVNERQTAVKFDNNEIRYYDVAGELTQAIRERWETDTGSTVKEVKIGNAVTSIGVEAFAYCDSLTSVTIPDSVTSIGSSAFEICSNLTRMTIPNSVASVGSYVFSGCFNLANITVVGKNQAQAEALLLTASVSPSIITTWNDASQEWVKEQNYLSSVPSTYKTYQETVSLLSNDGYALSIDVDTLISSISTDLSTEGAQPNALYVISSNNIDAYGQRLINLADGISSSDAATINQLSILSCNVSNLTSAIANALSSAGILVNTQLSDITLGNVISAMYNLCQSMS